MIASTMTTATTPMIVFFLSILTSLAQNYGRFLGFAWEFAQMTSRRHC
jgi:hypothetical protein